MWYTVSTLHNIVSAVGKEYLMIRQQEEITALYCRLNQDDGREGESNSIVNQKEYLLKYANEHGFSNPKFYVDEYNLRLIQFDTETAVKPHKITVLGAKRQTESRYFCFMGFNAHLPGCIVAPSGQGWVQFCTQAEQMLKRYLCLLQVFINQCFNCSGVDAAIERIFRHD